MRAMKTTKTARHTGPTKAERRDHRKARDRQRSIGSLSISPLGGVMDPERFDRILAAAQRVDPSAPWSQVASMVLPILRRANHPYPPEAAPLHIYVPPGLWTGFGIDIGPAISHVTAALIDHWGIDQATLLSTALDNLRRLVIDEPPVVQRFRQRGVNLQAISGSGWGSTLLLVPDVLRIHLGGEPKMLLAPVRNTLIALPEDADTDLAVAVWHALADGAHDELDVEPLRWTGSAVVALGDGSGGLPN